jgi:superfamily II DNA or RNA helicase
MEKYVLATNLNESYAKIEAMPEILIKIAEHFRFFAEGYKFSRPYREGRWDGYTYLYNPITQILPRGLLPRLDIFCEERGYTLAMEMESNVEASRDSIDGYIKTLGLPSHLKLQDYQFNSIHHAINNPKSLIISPTGSGKSLIIYALLRYWKKPTLILVPNIGLVKQTYESFVEYSENDKEFLSQVTTISKGRNRDTSATYVISTWQSIFTLPPKWFDRYEVILVDEAHRAKATSIKGIVGKCTNASVRIGLTATMNKIHGDILTLEGYLGKPCRFTTSAELIERGVLSNLTINCILLKYPSDIIQIAKPLPYHKQKILIATNKKRIDFVVNLVKHIDNNILVLFDLVEKHGIILYDKMQSSIPTRNIYYIDGKSDDNYRESVRQLVDKDKNAIIIASAPTFSTGINIRNLHSLVFALPSKSEINILQSIGRALRKKDGINKAVVYDIVDDMTDRSFKNYAWKHFQARLEIYQREQFDYRVMKTIL